MRALTRLSQASITLQASVQQTKGKPDEMPLDKIMWDTENPRPPLHLRTPEEQQQQRELNANIKKRGVKSPISLRPHPTNPEMWIINHGHCRYDGAAEAGLPTIPYFIDPNFDSYDQVAENLHRADLSPWSIAEFIKRKLKEKETKGQIAEGLGKESESYITEHLALVDAPKCLHQAYLNGVRSTRTLYDLRRAYEEFPEQVETWCEDVSKITRTTIQELLQRMRQERAKTEAGAEVQLPRITTELEFRHDEKNPPTSPSRQLTAKETDRETEETASVQKLPPTAEPHLVGNAALVRPPPATSPEFRHDEKKPRRAEQKKLSSGPADARPSAGEMLVQYKGMAATIDANTQVKILVDGHDVPLEVPLSELVFEGRQ